MSGRLFVTPTLKTEVVRFEWHISIYRNRYRHAPIVNSFVTYASESSAKTQGKKWAKRLGITVGD